jgi:hypothetical protein
MPFSFANLDDHPSTRQHMVGEWELDESRGALYKGKRLTDVGIAAWKTFLRTAIEEHNEVWLAQMMSSSQHWKSHEERAKPKGGMTLAKVPRNAHEVLAEGEFLRFYLRGVCQRAIQDQSEVEVVRLKVVSHPRAESEAAIGRPVNPAELLDDLRNGINAILGIPAGPNSGLGVRIVVR